jgi:hypothetical protein
MHHLDNACKLERVLSKGCKWFFFSPVSHGNYPYTEENQQPAFIAQQPYTDSSTVPFAPPQIPYHLNSDPHGQYGFIPATPRGFSTLSPSAPHSQRSHSPRPSPRSSPSGSRHRNNEPLRGTEGREDPPSYGDIMNLTVRGDRSIINSTNSSRDVAEQPLLEQRNVPVEVR